jgi:hypothetical protein
MAMTNTPVFPQNPATEIATLTSPTAITSRANITGTTGLTLLTAVPSVNSKRVDSITVKSKGTSVAGQLYIWLFDGTTSYLYDEIDLTAVTPSTTVDSFTISKSYLSNAVQGSIQLKVTQQLYVSVSVVQDLNVFATTGQY